MITTSINKLEPRTLPEPYQQREMRGRLPLKAHGPYQPRLQGKASAAGDYKESMRKMEEALRPKPKPHEPPRAEKAAP
jgi:hypothetical protein